MAWTLLCECGHEFDIKEDDFPGRRLMRYCGRPECEFAPKPKVAKRRERGASYSVYLHESHSAKLFTYARKHHCSFSSAIENLIDKGEAYELLSED